MRTSPLTPAPASVRPDLAAARRAGDRAGLAAALAAYQRTLDADAAAVAAAERLADPDAAVIVTGQQPGLLGGPWLTLHKAFSAIAWAERLAAESGRPVIPVFWVASEDHDLDEVNRVDLLDAKDEPVRLSLPREPDGTMLSHVDPGAAADDLLRDAEAALPPSEFRDAVMGGLRAALAPSLGTWFARILARRLSARGLVIVEPRLVRTAAAAVLRTERENPGAIAAAVLPGPVTPAAPPFFLVRDGRRARPAGAAELPDDPEAVSFDVVTRVLAQNVVFPVAGHVVGPSEAVYCAQFAPAHALFGVPAPPLIPRASLTLVEGKVEKALAAFGRTVEDVVAGGEAALAPEDLRPEEFDRALTRLTELLEEGFPDLRSEAGKVDETLLRKAEGAEREMFSALDRLRDHARKAMERVTGQDAERRRKVLAHLLPGGMPQDRGLSPLPFLCRHGEGLVDRLLDVVRAEPSGRLAVYLKGR